MKNETRIQTNGYGILYVIALPIGNHSDISERAKSTLALVDCIACEDTRVTGQLLKILSIRKKLISYYDQVENQKALMIINLLQEGKHVALVSDAGTPLISDPGFVLLKQARAAGVEIVPLPGPSSVITALSVSGIASNNFYFAGFLPKQSAALAREFSRWNIMACTVAFFESPRRVKDTLELMAKFFPARNIFIAREMTKVYEEFFFDTVERLANRFPVTVKGEIVAVLEGGAEPQADQAAQAGLARRLLSLGLSRKDIITVLSEELSISRNDLKRIPELYKS